MSNLKEKLGKPVSLQTEQKAMIEEVNQLLLTTSTKEAELLRDLNLKTSLSVKTERAQELTQLQNLTMKHGELFTIDQIQSLALTYNLRFLKIEHYKEEVPQVLGSELLKIAEEMQFVGYSTKQNLGPRTYILAPANHFNLLKSVLMIDLRTPEPQDPGVFVEIQSGLFKLVYSWGSDLNIINMMAGIVKHNPISIWVSWVIPALVCILPLAFLWGFITYVILSAGFLMGTFAIAMSINSNIEVWDDPKTSETFFKVLWPWS